MTMTETIVPNPGESLADLLDRCGDDLTHLDDTLTAWLAESVLVERPNLGVQVRRNEEEGRQEKLDAVAANLEANGDYWRELWALEKIHNVWQRELLDADNAGNEALFQRVIAALPPAEVAEQMNAIRCESQPWTTTVEDRTSYRDSVTGQEHSGRCLVFAETSPHPGDVPALVLSPDTVAMLNETLTETQPAEETPTGLDFYELFDSSDSVDQLKKMSAEERRAFADRFRTNCNLEANADDIDAIMALIDMEVDVVAQAEEHLESNADEGTYDGDD